MFNQDKDANDASSCGMKKSKKSEAKRECGKKMPLRLIVPKDDLLDSARKPKCL